MTADHPRRHALRFTVTLRDGAPIALIAAEVNDALGVALAPSNERGLQDDYVGELAGMALWLRVNEPATRDTPQDLALLGGPRLGGPGPAVDPDARWVDISPYIAELLTVGGGRPWSSD